jgi:hypothetical protein
VSNRSACFASQTDYSLAPGHFIGYKVVGGGGEWFAVIPETVIEVARMIMGKPT